MATQIHEDQLFDASVYAGRGWFCDTGKAEELIQLLLQGGTDTCRMKKHCYGNVQRGTSSHRKEHNLLLGLALRYTLTPPLGNTSEPCGEQNYSKSQPQKSQYGA